MGMERQSQSANSNMGKGSIENNDEPESKKPKHGPRKRVSQACDRCRSRKDKCDGKRPACSTCTTHNRQCSYDANVKKRGLPEGYVRGMEKLWGVAIKEVQGLEDNMLLALTSEENDRYINIWNDEGNSDNLVDLWRKSQILTELERLLSTPEPSNEFGKRKRTDSENKNILAGVSSISNAGHDSHKQDIGGWEDRRLDIRNTDTYRNSPRLSGFYDFENLSNKGYNSILSPSHQRPASSNLPANTSEVPELPSEAWHLLDVYFSYTHCWLPIIEKHDLLRTSYQYSQNRHNLSASGTGDHAALWAAMAYGKFQHRTINNIPHAQGPVADMVWTAERVYAHARSLIPNEEGVLQLGHVQALLILALANLGIDQPGRAWSLVGQAVRIALDLRLDHPSDDPLAALKSKSRNKHVLLGCFLLDTIIAARLGRRPHLRADDADRVGAVEEDGLEEWDPWTDCLSVRRNHSGNSRAPASILSTFNQLIQVSRILNEAICSFDSQNRVQLSTTLLVKLQSWSQTQSLPLYFDTTAMKSEQATSLLPHHYHLHLVYFNTLAFSQLLGHIPGNEKVNLEPSTRSARHIADLLKQHLNNFGPLIVPPTFEYFTKTAYDVIRQVNENIATTQVMLNDWKHNLDNCLEAMEPAWPIFESLKKSPLYQSNLSTPRGRRKSEVAYDLISGMNPVVDTPMTVQTPNSMASYDILSHNMTSPQIPISQSAQSAAASQSSMMNQSPVPHRTSFGQSSARAVPPNFQQSPQSPFNPSWSLNNPPQRSLVLPPHLQNSMSLSSEFELDPTFQEFATLDATEWTNNWDQSLQNLGFTDPDNKNQDFYHMSREPDPLFQNNVFQQLVANSNAEATEFFDSSMFGGLGAAGFENEGIEAGQILQSLSAAEGPMRGRRNR